MEPTIYAVYCRLMENMRVIDDEICFRAKEGELLAEI
jgi:hypothetical protein